MELRTELPAACKAGNGFDPEAASLEMADAKALLIDNACAANGLDAAADCDELATDAALGAAPRLIPFAARKLIPAAEAAPMLPDVKLVIRLAGTVPPEAALTAAASVLPETGAARPDELVVPLIAITFRRLINPARMISDPRQTAMTDFGHSQLCFHQ